MPAALCIKTAKTVLSLKDSEQCNREMWNDNKNIHNGNKLRTYRTYKIELKQEHYLTISNSRHRQILAKFRCGNLKLNIETGRYNKTPLQDRKCILCDSGAIEDEVHFLIDCNFYSDLRFYLFYSALEILPDFLNCSSCDKLSFLMNEPSLQGLLASTVFKMYRRRICF